MSINWAGSTEVLVVEDSLVNRTLLQHWLAAAGAIVYQASTLEAARTILQQLQPTHLIVDQQLPDGDGTSLYLQYKASQTGKWIACTMLEDDAHAQKLLNIGFDAVLAKPLTLTEVKTVLSQSVKTHKTREQPVPASQPEMFDYQGALIRLGGDAELMHILATSFLEEWGELPTLLHQSSQSGDLALLSRQAHTVGGLSGQFGLLLLQQRLQLLERLSQDPSWDNTYLQALVAAVESAFELSVPALRDAVSSPEHY